MCPCDILLATSTLNFVSFIRNRICREDPAKVLKPVQFTHDSNYLRLSNVGLFLIHYPFKISEKRGRGFFSYFFNIYTQLNSNDHAFDTIRIHFFFFIEGDRYTNWKIWSSNISTLSV